MLVRTGLFLLLATVAPATYAAAQPAPPPPPPVGPAGPPPPRNNLAPMSAAGKVKTILYNPEGLSDGVILDDGTQVHLGPHSALAERGVSIGTRIAATGTGGTYVHARSLRADTLQIEKGPVVQLEGPRPRP